MDCFFGSKAVIFSRRIAAGGDGHPGVAAVGFFHYSVPVPGQGVEDQLILAAAGDGASRSVGQGGPGRDNLVMQLLGLFVDRRNGGSGQDIVELVQEHLFPVGVPFRIRERKAVLHGQGAPHFGLPESQLGFPVAFFHRSLAGVNAPVAGEIKLAHIGVLRAAFRFQVLEDLAGMGHFKFGAAFQVLFPQGEFDVIPAGTAAAVAVAVRQQEFVQAVLLDPVVPNVNELFGVGGIGVVGGQVGNDLAAVHALPGEVVVGELVAAVVAPEDLLGHQVFDAAALQNLGQGRRIAEGIGQPEDFAVHAQLIFKVPHTVDQLAHQGFAGSHIGVRFHPHAAFRDPAAGFDGRFDALEQLRIIFLAEGVGLGLALEELIAGIFFDEPQLGGKGPGHLPFGFSQGPQPHHVQMGVADAVEGGGGAAVDAGKGVFQDFPALFVVGDPAFQGLLKIHGQGKVLQSLGDFRGPQAAVRQALHDFRQGLHVHPKLISVLVPDAVGVFAHSRPQLPGFGVLIAAGQHRAGSAVGDLPIGEEMTGVSLSQDVEPVAGFGVLGEDVVLHKVVGNGDPVGPAGAEGLPVDKKGGFAAGVQVHYDHLAFRFRRQGDSALQPHIFPFIAPDGPFGYRRVAGQLCRVFRLEVLIGAKPLKGNLAQRLIKIFLQRGNPVPQPVVPFRRHFHFDHLP